jgi:hypothetical protein
MLAERTFPARPDLAPAPVRRVNLRLDEQLVRQLLAGYQAGRTGRELAEQYGLARSTVIGLLRQHGMAVRYPWVTPEEAAEMVRLYQSGVRQVDIAARFGRDQGNIWHVLNRAGASIGFGSRKMWRWSNAASISLSLLLPLGGSYPRAFHVLPDAGGTNRLGRDHGHRVLAVATTLPSGRNCLDRTDWRAAQNPGMDLGRLAGPELCWMAFTP